MTTLFQSDKFFEFSRQVAQKFIQSVVAVDDEMEFSARPKTFFEEEELIEPENSLLGFNYEIQSSNLEKSNFDNSNKLYYQDLSFEFAEKAIICSGLKPYPEENKTINAIFKSSINSDITILDWQMETDGDWGRITTKVIKKIIEDDIKNGGRLRLFVIYTAENQETVLDTLATILTEQEPLKNNNYIDFKKSELKLCRICIISKQTNEKGLSEEVIKLFTELTVGILSNAALASISEMRDNTHNILYKFNKNLDPAYLSHVFGLISSPDMREQAHEVAFDYAVDLISEEIKSELQISPSIKSSLSVETLSTWPDYINIENKPDIFAIKVGEKEPVKFGSQRMKRLLTVKNDQDLDNILNESPQFPRKKGKTILEYFKENVIELSINGEDSSNTHLELSAIECLRRDKLSIVKGHIPVLKQGSVLKLQQEYFICIQPICDSVRLENETGFIFLKVEKIDGEVFSHVVRDEEQNYRKLKLKNLQNLLILSILLQVRIKQCQLSRKMENIYLNAVKLIIFMSGVVSSNNQYIKKSLTLFMLTYLE